MKKKACSKMGKVKSHLKGDEKSWNVLSKQAKHEASRDKELVKQIKGGKYASR